MVRGGLTGANSTAFSAYSMNEADVLASTGRRCIWTTHVPGSFYTNTLPVPDGSRGGDLSIKLWKNFRQLSAPLLARALTCISLSLLTFSLPGGPLALPAGGEPGSRFLRGGLQMCRLLEQLGLSYPG